VKQSFLNNFSSRAASFQQQASQQVERKGKKKEKVKRFNNLNI